LELDFLNKRVTFSKGANRSPSGNLNIVAQAPLGILPERRLYTVDVYFDGKGPVSMLVDTTASVTMLSWKGVDALGLSRDIKYLQQVGPETGNTESESKAAQLTHRLTVNSLFQLGDKTMGLSLEGNQLAIAVGSIPDLDDYDNTGRLAGVLGIDVLLRFSVCRIEYQENPPITLLLANA
jgi:hypothetical protein